MDDIFILSQLIVDTVTPSDNVGKTALAFQRVNEYIQKLTELLENIEDHHLNKHKLVKKKELDWWQKEQFDLHSRFFEKIYETLSGLQFICSYYPALKNLKGKKNRNSKFLNNLSTLNNVSSAFQSSLDLLEQARKFRSDYLTHSMNAGSVDWVTISDRVYFLRDPRNEEQTSVTFDGKVVAAIPDESKVFESLLIVVREIYQTLLN